MQDREIKSECHWDNGIYIIKILQTDAVNLSGNDENPFEIRKYGITAIFDDELVLKDISVDYLQGSKKELCAPVKETIKQLIGAQVGKGFGKKVKELSGDKFCMHFEVLLPQIASLAFRAKFFRMAHTDGRDSFSKAYGKVFNGKCLGHSIKEIVT